MSINKTALNNGELIINLTDKNGHGKKGIIATIIKVPVLRLLMLVWRRDQNWCGRKLKMSLWIWPKAYIVLPDIAFQKPHR
jgi:hypothetical protein